MTLDTLLGNQSVIISLDVDTFLFERLEQIANFGVSLVEINTTDTKLLKKAVTQYPSIRIGAGGLTTTQQIEDCYTAGVHFATSPGFLPAMALTARVYSMNYLPGVATISEAMEALSIGYEQVRPFPASLPLCSLLNKTLPHLKLFPSEVEWEEAEHFLNLPSVVAIGIHNPDKKQLKALSSGILV
jgi:2-dehydro-3-deoxyphosphogluconate aldolase / (4S)-4-hydroxy-2-oxoglutarate aldolase